MSDTVLDGLQMNSSVVRLIKGDITMLEVDAFVFYAQHDLVLGSGFGTAITVRGGPTIQKGLAELAPVATGQAVVSGAGKLKASHIIHAVGPRFQEEDIAGKLRTTVANSLQRAEEKQVKRLALPAMGAGYYGIAPELCAQVMVEVIENHLAGETGLDEVIICVLDTRQYDCFQAALAAVS